MKTLLILGAGGHAKVVADCAIATQQWDKVVFLDDRYPELQNICNWQVIGRISDLEHHISDFPNLAVGVGANADALRLEWIERGKRAGANFPPIVHPSATVSPFATIGDGSVVFAGAVINIDTAVGSGCIINTVASVDHDCVIEDGAHISPGAILAGGVTVRTKAWVGMGAKVLQGKSIGVGSVVGAGSVVLTDIPDQAKVIGIPARLI